MNINERVRQVRKKLNMTQTEFGTRLSITQNHLSGVEIGRRDVSDRIIKIMCHEFNVNEHWLRTGEGEMFVQPTTFSLDEEAKKNNLSELEIAIMRSYMSLDRDTRNKLMDELEAIFRKKISSEIAASTVESTPEQIAEEDAERYRLERLAELKGEITSSASKKPDKKIG